MPVRALVSPVAPDILIEDGDKPEVPGWDVTAIWTPGHSPGHLCFYEPEPAADAVGRPRAAPHHAEHLVPPAGRAPIPWATSWHPWTKSAAYDVDEVLPAHEYRFVGPAGAGRRS